MTYPELRKALSRHLRRALRPDGWFARRELRRLGIYIEPLTHFDENECVRASADVRSSFWIGEQEIADALQRVRERGVILEIPNVSSGT